ncbi:MAG: hypothetical protein QG656_2326, partial [Candidatus Hydrogenedentes bacterium]|nr:hypothetical protein [Candidatus Hydrogenedentota bacterium]
MSKFAKFSIVAAVLCLDVCIGLWCLNRANASGAEGEGEGECATWLHTYGGSESEYGYCAKETPDGGYVVAGSTWFNSAGQEDASFFKIDACGAEVWRRTFGGTWNDAAYSVIAVDGGYVLAGSTWSFGAGGEDAYLTKTDSEGQQLWTNTFGGEGYDAVYGVLQTPEGGYLLAGESSSFGSGAPGIFPIYDMYLVKTDAVGNEVWSRTFGGTNNDRAYSVALAADGGYVLAGSTWSSGAGESDVYLVKTDAEGNTLWERTYGGVGSEEAQCVLQTADGGHLLAGHTSSFGMGSYDVYWVKTDAAGNEEWAHTWGGPELELGLSAMQTEDGRYVLAGCTQSFGTGEEFACWIKTDTQGNLRWRRTFSGWHNAAAQNVLETSDGGYLFCGATTMLDGSGANVFVAKTDAEGEVVTGDADLDGMPDEWELGNGLNPEIDDSREDPDEDRFPNIMEFFNGTDPFVR